MSRTLAIDGCHELCLLHLSDLNRVRHALIELTAGQILVSSDLTSQCLDLIVCLDETLDVTRPLVVFSNLYRLSSVIISSIIEMALMIRRSGIIQCVDLRPSVTSFWTSRSLALTIIHHDHVHLSADVPEMLLTHWSRDRQTLHLSLHVHDHSGVVLEADEDAFLPVPGLPLTDHHHGLLPEHRLALLHEAQTRDVKPRHCDLVQGKRRSAPFVRLCSARLPAIVHSSALDRSSDQSEYGYDRPRSRSRYVLPWSGLCPLRPPRRSSVRVVSALASAYDTRSAVTAASWLCASWSVGT